MKKTWNNITIKIYQSIYQDNLKGWELLSAISQTPVSELENLKATELDKLISEYSFVNSEPNAVLATNWNGYHLLNLTAKETAGQIIDFLSVVEMGDIIANQHLILATLLRDKNKKESFEQRADVIRENMPITVAMGISDFFFQAFNPSKKTIRWYSQRLMMIPTTPEMMNKAMDFFKSSNGKFG